MNREGSRELSLRLFSDAVKDGTMDAKMQYYVTYSHYLCNGGTPQGWNTLSSTDIAMMSIFYAKDREQQIEGQSILNANAMCKAMFGGNNYE